MVDFRSAAMIGYRDAGRSTDFLLLAFAKFMLIRPLKDIAHRLIPDKKAGYRPQKDVEAPARYCIRTAATRGQG
jgi:hypothetical protein